MLFGLSASANLKSLTEDLLNVLSPEGSGAASSTVVSSEYKLRATVSLHFKFRVNYTKSSIENLLVLKHHGHSHILWEYM